MHAPLIKSLLLLPALAFVALASTSAPASSPAAPAAKANAAPVLAKGMTEQQIIAAIGHPQETKPLKVPNADIAKAETWIYRRLVDTRQTQVATGTRPIAAFNGMGMGNEATGTAQEIIYSTKYIKIYQVTSLLMVDGKLELARQTTETEERF